MSVYAIGDLHLPGHSQKPMDVFGSHWDRHFETISENWRNMISPEDVVLIPGDISWAMQLAEALDDLRAIAELPGTKLLLRGNHDYWWSSLNKLRSALPEKMYVIQNDAMMIDGHVFCGTRGWNFPTAAQGLGEQDEKVYQRELLRLKMSLDQAVKLGGDDLTVMLHFPPLFADGISTGFTEILESYPVTQVVYGHLHGAGIKIAFEGEKEGIRYRLVSCDALNFAPVQVLK
ncbi:MAG: metallophosphoesterase [Clostridia bacterium]|nr:metallophosphoesterase [Clostridia bacterium]